LEGKPIPKGKLAFFQERFRDHLYELVVSEFLKREQAGTLTKKALAQRLHKDPSQITRWLAAPGNWEIGTASDLLLAIAQAEPVISLSSLAGRAQQTTQIDARLETLSELEKTQQQMKVATSTSSNTDKKRTLSLKRHWMARKPGKN
jgi:hypothetical protein